MTMRLLVGFCLTTFLWAAPKPPSSPEALIFTNVNVVDTRQGEISPNMTVVVKGGLITGVAKVGLIGQGHHIQVINAHGKYLIPGLWDMHVHSAFVPGTWDEKIIYPLYVANGVTGIRDMGGDLDLLVQRRDRIARGELPGPRMILAGPFLVDAKGDRQTITVVTPEDARKAVDTVKARGVDFVKILSNLSRDSYFAVAEEAAKDKIRFAGHVPDSVSVAEASSAGQVSIEHLTGVLLACSSQESALREQRLKARTSHDYAAFSGLATQVMATYDPDKAHRLFLELAKNQTWQVPTLVWTEASANIDAPNLGADPRLKYIPASVKEQWKPEKLLKQTPAQQLADLKKEAARNLELVDAMQKAGVQFMAGTDGPDPYVFPGFSLHDELEWMVKSGFTPLQALQAATLNPALFLVKPEQYGVVEPGHVADLVLLDGDPLEDIRNTRKISAVVVAGKYYSRKALDSMLDQVEKTAAKR
jgi:imidazolonepropionase-like amidohydrolase